MQPAMSCAKWRVRSTWVGVWQGWLAAAPAAVSTALRGWLACEGAVPGRLCVVAAYWCVTVSLELCALQAASRATRRQRCFEPCWSR